MREDHKDEVQRASRMNDDNENRKFTMEPGRVTRMEQRSNTMKDKSPHGIGFENQMQIWMEKREKDANQAFNIVITEGEEMIDDTSCPFFMVKKK
jgi:hypothetical protein